MAGSLISKAGNSLNSVGSGIASAGNLISSYNKLRNNFAVAAGKNSTAKLTGVAQTLMNLSNTASGIEAIWGIGGADDSSFVQNSVVNPQPGAFKWVEVQTMPEEFASADSILIFVGEPLYADNPKGATYSPIGMCRSFSFNSGVHVNHFQELRCEEYIIIPGKTMPFTISIDRICGKWSNMCNKLHLVNTGWNYNPASKGFRDLFGLLIYAMDTSRKRVIGKLYFERCAITSFDFGMQAGEYQVLERVNIIAGRCIDPDAKSQAAEVEETIAAQTLAQMEAEKQEKERRELAEKYGVDPDDPKSGVDTYIDSATGERISTPYTTDANGNIVYADGRVNYRNGDTELPPPPEGGTYIAAENENDYVKSKEFKQAEKANDAAQDARDDLAAAEAKRKQASDKLSAAIAEGDSDKIAKASKELAKQDTKVTKAQDKVTQKTTAAQSAVTAYKNKVNQINTEKGTYKLSAQSYSELKPSK